jgi:hypothetical protein
MDCRSRQNYPSRQTRAPSVRFHPLEWLTKQGGYRENRAGRISEIGVHYAQEDRDSNQRAKPEQKSKNDLSAPQPLGLHMNRIHTADGYSYVVGMRGRELQDI